MINVRINVAINVIINVMKNVGINVMINVVVNIMVNVKINVEIHVVINIMINVMMNIQCDEIFCTKLLKFKEFGAKIYMDEVSQHHLFLNTQKIKSRSRSMSNLQPPFSSTPH